MPTEISSNIINQIGGGSGIDTRSLVNQLVELERAPEEQRLDRREEKLEAQISGFGMLRSAVDTLDNALTPLSDPDTFNAKSASISDTSLMTVNELNPNAVPGNYRIRIDQVAQSQSLSSAGYESLSSEVGQGSLNLRFGSWEDGSFTLDPEAEGAVIEIDDSNNTLGGLRDAINRADVGVQASIVGQAGNYQLLLTSPTGATRELEITADEAAGEPGLANFNFNEGATNLTEQQAGQDAILRVNGLEVVRQNNTITDVIDGLEFDIFNSNPNEEISINVSEDRSQAEEAIRLFVDSYNEFYKEVQTLLSRDEGEDGKGSLQNDPLARNMMRSMRSLLGGAVPGIEDGFNSLANMGIRTKLDGTLEIVEDGSSTDFRAAMDNNFDMVRNLFVPNTNSDSSRIDVTNFGSRTQAGSYEVEITQNATKGIFEGNELGAGIEFPLDTSGKDYSFTIRVDGNEANISLPEGAVYESGEELASELQSLINLDSNVRAGNARINVGFENNALSFQSNAWGAQSRVEFSNVSADMQADLGVSDGSGVNGLNVEGTIGGVEGFGFGNVLRGATGSPTEGLSMIVAQGATSATVNFSRGFGASLASMTNSYVRSSGLIANRESNIRNDLSEVADQRERLDRRSEAFRARQEAQFRAMEQIVRSLNNTGDFLENINDRLPFTSNNRR